MSDPVDTFARAEDATLDIIKRDADAYLAAQLTVALAGNQRAMTFFGFLAAATAVIGGGCVTAIAGHTAVAPCGWLGLVMLAGFLVSMFLANRAAMPDAFDYVGNTPANWVDDIVGGKPLATSKAEALADSARCIAQNRKVLNRSAQLTRWAVWLAWSSLTIGIVGALVITSITAQ